MSSDDLKNKAKDMSDVVAQSARSTIETARDQAANYGAQARDHAGRIGETANDLYEKTNNATRDALAQAPGYASDTLEAGQRVYRRGNEQLTARVAKQPIEALLLAGAIGYLVGWAANRG